MRATVVLDRGGRVLLRSAGADDLFATLAGMSTAPEPAGHASMGAVPDAVRCVVRRLVGAAQGESRDPVPRLAVTTPRGIVTLEAAWLAPQSAEPAGFAPHPGHALIAVTLDLSEPPAARAVRMLRAAGATPAQTRVGVLLALGKRKPEIARELGIKPASVEDATRKLYARLHVHNAAELSARVWLRAPEQDGAAREET